MSYLRIAAIYASLSATKADYLKSKIFGKVASYADIDGWIKANSWSAQTSPVEIGGVIASNFVWRADGWLDYALDPRVFLVRKADDCDGFSLFAEYVCNKLGIPAYRAYIKASSGRGHVVCVANNSVAIGNWQPLTLTGSTLAQHGQQIAQKMEGNMSYTIAFKGSSYQEYTEQ